jgi:putative NADH-flavin reductase
MKITVFGATGGTGRDLVRQAVAAGHDVTAVVRDPARLGSSSGVEVVRADVMDPQAIAPAVAGRDAAISALGHRPGGESQVSGPGAESIIAAMRATGARRLVVITAAGHIVDSADDLATRYLAKPVLRVLLRTNFADFARTDAVVSASGLDWTIMRPSRLTNGGHKPYRTAVDHTVRGGMSISRADLAKVTLDAAADPAAIGHAVAVGY